MVVVLPVCHKDKEMALRNLAWCKELDPAGVPFPCLVSHEIGFDANDVISATHGYFSAVQVSQYRPLSRRPLPWPQPQNWAWKQAVMRVRKMYKEPWLWWEQDAVPLRSGWLSTLADAYAKSGRVFLGAIGEDANGQVQKHLNGVAIYPPDVWSWGPSSMCSCNTIAFDVLGGWRVLNQSEVSPLIQHIWSWDATGSRPPCTFRNDEDYARISRDAVLFHRCRDSTLISWMRRGEPCRNPVQRKESQDVGSNHKGVISCFHSGDLGDIIYGLFFAKSVGRVRLTLGPDCSWRLRQAMNKQTFEWVLPLLERQSWIEKIEFSDSMPANLDFNLNEFRRYWFSHETEKIRHSEQRSSLRLFSAYPAHFGYPPLKEDIPWFECDPISDDLHPIVISRTSRYRNNDFPWRRVSAMYAQKMLFVGLKEEYVEWTRRYGETAIYRPVRDALELANVIAGARVFIGNQSLPMALALATNTPVIQETYPGTPDCVFQRPNAQYFIKTEKINWPSASRYQSRIVSTVRNSNGEYELGYCDGAYAIGDTLMITPLARALKDCVVVLPEEMRSLEWVFSRICPVRYASNAPVFPFVGGKLRSRAILDHFGYGQVSPLPKINVAQDMIDQAREWLSQYPNAVAFVPTCSKSWKHLRQKPPDFWIPIIKSVSARNTRLTFPLA